ncbi:MAG TPA: cysteine desulfurase family protein [Acidimicrobiia bacterium]|nr:cysteine desulfurase family protein [Acidimicrobiia bacterium]
MSELVDPAALAGRAYLDHASTSPLRPGARAAMLPFLEHFHADPGRVHTEGRITRVALEDARAEVAELFGARPREVVFTSGGTEAVNAAAWGALARDVSRRHVVTTAVEHSCVRDACDRAALDVSVVGVDRLGHFDPDEVVDAIRADTALVSVQLANHEVGTVQSAAEVAAAARGHDTLVHIDACAAAGHIPVSFAELDTDLCSISAHKLGGPKGAGALLVRRGLRIPPLLVGGAQERARRGGMENVPAWVGFGAACAELLGTLPGEADAARALIARAATVIDTVPGVARYGDPLAALPHVLCFGVEGVEAEPIVLALDQHGVAVHSGSACSSETLEPSPVLAAMGVDADHSLRVSVGWSSTPADVERFVTVFPDVVARLRSLRA